MSDVKIKAQEQN